MFTRAFWTAAAERAISTFAQTAGGVIGVGAVTALEVDWASVLGVGAVAALLSVLKSLAAGRHDGSPSLVPGAEVEAAVN